MRADADPALFARWAIGWTMTRARPAPIAIPGGWRVESVKPDHRWRFLYPTADPAIGNRAHAPLDAPFHIKVAAAAARVRPLLPAGWSIDDTTCLMTHRGQPPAAALPPNYTATVAAPYPDVVRVEIADAAGALAASGQIALVDDMAVFDQIETDATHRRRGLGRAVMAMLAREAEAAGAAIGMLAATAEGAALYATLGWQRHAPYLTAKPPVG